MTSFLSDVLAEIRLEIRRPDYLDGLPPEPARPRAPFSSAVAAAPYGWALLVERKFRSPGARPPELPERPVEEFVNLVEAGRAEALSCLATRPGFGGSPLEVYRLASRTRLPVLFKEFVIDPIQIEAARRSGASAILLIARLESEGRLDRPLADLAERARRAGLEVLLELHAVEELKVAGKISADLYGVNVRDLDTLAFRPDVAEVTMRSLGDDRLALGLSGVEGPEEARRFRRWGADGILVGGAFARSRDPAGFLSALRGVGAEGAR